jgi:hypothetical protein
MEGPKLDETLGLRRAGAGLRDPALEAAARAI